MPLSVSTRWIGTPQLLNWLTAARRDAAALCRLSSGYTAVKAARLRRRLRHNLDDGRPANLAGRTGLRHLRTALRRQRCASGRPSAGQRHHGVNTASMSWAAACTCATAIQRTRRETCTRRARRTDRLDGRSYPQTHTAASGRPLCRSQKYCASMAEKPQADPQREVCSHD